LIAYARGLQREGVEVCAKCGESGKTVSPRAEGRGLDRKRRSDKGGGSSVEAEDGKGLEQGKCEFYLSDCAVK